MENAVQTKFLALLIALSTFAAAPALADDPTRTTVTVNLTGAVQDLEAHPIQVATGSSSANKVAKYGTFTFAVQPGNNTVVIQTDVINDKVYYGELDVSAFTPGNSEQVEVAMQPLPVVEVITTSVVSIHRQDGPNTVLAVTDKQVAYQKRDLTHVRRGTTPLAGWWVLQPGTYSYNARAVPKQNGFLSLNGKVTPFDASTPLELAPGDHVVITFGPAIN